MYKNKFHPNIELIKLENFQSLRDPTEIPIKPLTFLYGPNSAGKSAIFDSLVFLESIINGSYSEIDENLNRWQYIEKNDQNLKPVKIEIKFTDDVIFRKDPYFGASAEYIPKEIYESVDFLEMTGEFTRRVNLIISASIDETDSHDLIRKFRIELNGLPLLEITSLQEDGDCPSLKLFPDVIGSSLQDLANRHGIDSSQPNVFIADCWIKHSPFHLEPGISFEESHDFDRDLISVANFFIAHLVGRNFSPQLVNADRGVIPNESLSAICNSIESIDHYALNGDTLPNSSLGFRSISTQSPDDATSHLSKVSSNTIQSLITSRANEEIINKIKNACLKHPYLLGESKADASNIEIKLREPLHSFVNRCLADHLFIDQGYQIAYEVCEILPSKSDILVDPMPQLSKNSRGDYYYNLATLIICSLIDAAGRRATFQDVGTGISCILPVITTLYSSNSFIQQPELHLHPALQSSVGDILIEVLKNPNKPFHIIETHSEYILLRCLKRIRETSNGKIREIDPLALNPNDICVLYFEPQGDGSTKVKRLRVSSQGEFLDRWPRGFFEERGKELFDE